MLIYPALYVTQIFVFQDSGRLQSSIDNRDVLGFLAQSARL